MREVRKRTGVTQEQLKALGATLRVLHAQFARNVVQGEALKVHRPSVRFIQL
jgi:hypothetical protein